MRQTNYTTEINKRIRLLHRMYQKYGRKYMDYLCFLHEQDKWGWKSLAELHTFNTGEQISKEGIKRRIVRYKKGGENI